MIMQIKWPAGKPRNRRVGKLWKDATKTAQFEKRAHIEKTWVRLEKEKRIMLCSLNKLKNHRNKNFLMNFFF